MEGEIVAAIKQICYEKNLEYDMVLDAIESALAAAYRKDFGDKTTQNIEAEFDPDTVEVRVFDVKTVVEDMTEEEIEDEENEKTFNQRNEIMLSDAKKINKKYKVGDTVRQELEIPSSFGRMAAQTAKQVIIQKLREAEREGLFEDFKEREGTMMTGVINRHRGRDFLIDFGKVSGILTKEEQIPREYYKIGDRLDVYIKSVEHTNKGPRIIVSRSHPEIVRVLFFREIPEISSGDIEIKNIVRDAGFRTKVSVYTEVENLDPIGSCIGQRGSRIQTIINELGGEKIDIIQWDSDIKKYIANALAPAQVNDVDLNEEEQSAIVSVPKEQLSLAIGRNAQNVRLAVQLTGWNLSIRDDDSGEVVESTVDKKAKSKKATSKEEVVEEKVSKDEKADKTAAKKDKKKTKKEVKKKTKKDSE